MNNEPSDEKRRLLNELFRADSLDPLSGRLKEQAWAEFRRARFLRQTASIGAAAAIVAVLIAGGLLFRSFLGTKTTSLVAVPSGSQQTRQKTAQPKASAGDTTITDEQLLAFFPSNSCFLAEVEGRKVLVFRTAELRQKYLH